MPSFALWWLMLHAVQVSSTTSQPYTISTISLEPATITTSLPFLSSQTDFTEHTSVSVPKETVEHQIGRALKASDDGESNSKASSNQLVSIVLFCILAFGLVGVELVSITYQRYKAHQLGQVLEMPQEAFFKEDGYLSIGISKEENKRNSLWPKILAQKQSQSQTAKNAAEPTHSKSPKAQSLPKLQVEQTLHQAFSASSHVSLNDHTRSRHTQTDPTLKWWRQILHALPLMKRSNREVDVELGHGKHSSNAMAINPGREAARAKRQSHDQVEDNSNTHSTNKYLDIISSLMPKRARRATVMPAPPPAAAPCMTSSGAGGVGMDASRNVDRRMNPVRSQSSSEGITLDL